MRKPVHPLHARVNLSKLLTALTNDVIARIVLGRKYTSEEGGNDSNTLVRRYMEIVGAFPFGEYIPSLAWVDKVRGFDRKVDKLNNEIDRFLEKVVQEHVDADEGRSNFVGILLSTQRDKTTPFQLDRTSLKNLLLVKQSHSPSFTYFSRKKNDFVKYMN